MVVVGKRELMNGGGWVVTVKCKSCGGERDMYVTQNASVKEHAHGCPLADITAYLTSWAFELRCPSCGKEADADEDRETSDLRMSCRCYEIRERAHILDLANSALDKCRGKGLRRGEPEWVYTRDGLHCEADSLSGGKERVARDAAIYATEAEYNGEPLPEFCLTVREDGEGGEEFYVHRVELPVDAVYDDYLRVVKMLKKKAAKALERGKAYKHCNIRETITSFYPG